VRGKPRSTRFGRLSAGFLLKAACDDCISERLGLAVRQHANHKTRELTGEPGFKRELDECGLCGTRKLVIRRTWSRLSFTRVNRIVKA